MSEKTKKAAKRVRNMANCSFLTGDKRNGAVGIPHKNLWEKVYGSGHEKPDMPGTMERKADGTTGGRRAKYLREKRLRRNVRHLCKTHNKRVKKRDETQRGRPEILAFPRACE